jgi:transcriptional regulator with XRE-family HTH domain
MGDVVDFVRIGDKLISRDKLNRAIDRILDLRTQGQSQQDVAHEMGVDRSFISRLEGLGEIRKGGRIALIGFPVANKDELQQLGTEEGCDFIFLMTNNERWKWVDTASGVTLLNEVMMLIASVKDFETIIFIGSDMRIRLMEAVLGRDVIPISVGGSPVTEDKFIDLERLRSIIRELRA